MAFDEEKFKARLEWRRANLEQETEFETYIRGFFDGLYAAGVLIPSNQKMPAGFWSKAKTGFRDHWAGGLGREFVMPPHWDD